MPGFAGLTVDEPSGPRWELALSLIESGEAPVRLGTVQLWRATAGPSADGLLHATIEADQGITEAAAREMLRRSRQQIDEVAAADKRFAELLRRYHCRWEVVHNYGMGTLLLATSDNEDDFVWEPGSRPLRRDPERRACA